VLPTYHAVVLDAALSPVRKVSLSGGPSRARLSPDSDLFAVTVFVAGHSYLQSGFSTLTTVSNALTGKLLANLEDFRVVRDGKPYRSVDLNMWGVTFVDSDRFFATAASRGKTWLVEGSLSARELRTIRENAECPSVSPDGTRIAYKHRIGLVRWRLHVLDLKTGRDVELTESRSVDDQVEWLDGDRILYGLPREGSAETDVWVVPADGTGSPAVFIPYAWSPSVVH
jgi:Tol biopolymer transport system component